MPSNLEVGDSQMPTAAHELCDLGHGHGVSADHRDAAAFARGHRAVASSASNLTNSAGDVISPRGRGKCITKRP